MRGQPASYTFNGVDVGLPSKVRSSEAEEEWQEVDWANWTMGDLTVDASSYLLVFKPSGPPGVAVKAKPLGNMIRASAVCREDEEGRTLVVTTSDALHRLYRLTFETTRNAQDFQRLADAAEAAAVAAASLGDASGGAGGEAEAKLLEDIRAKLASRWPLIYGGVELYGPDPGMAENSEVLLGRGAAVLLDPVEDGRVGTYELLVYGEDEGTREPLKRITIAPRMALTRQKTESEDDGPAVVFELGSGQHGVPSHSIAFDSAAVAMGFARDFRVRQRLMEVSLKTVAGSKAAERLRGEIEGIRQRSLGARLWRFMRLIVLLLLLVAVARVAQLYSQDKGAKNPAMYAEVLLGDVKTLAGLSHKAVTSVSAKVCQAAVGSLPASEVRRCAALAVDMTPGYPKATPAKLCLEALVGPV